MRTIVLGTRKSNLAMKQTEWVVNELNQRGLPYQFDTKKIVTKGDKILDVTLSKVGGKGLFIKEIEEALTNREIDIAVHSMKDLPGEVEEGFRLGAVTNRVDPRDVLISTDHVLLDDLPAGAVVGTSSLRRSSQILARRPDLKIQWIRGNIDTRLRKLREENFDAIVLAAAGLTRMGWDEKIVTEYLDPDICLPAVGQGALGLECREDDQEVLDILAELNDDIVSRRVTAERAFLQTVEGGCQVPIGGYAMLESNGDISLTAMIGSPDGETVLTSSRRGPEPETVGKQAAEELLQQGGREILDKVKDELDQT